MTDSERIESCNQAATSAIARPSTIRISMQLQSTHLNLCCSANEPTGVISQSNITAWHFGHTRPLIFAALISVRRCDIMLPLVSRERNTLSHR
jgi:hypothetical protein